MGYNVMVVPYASPQPEALAGNIQLFLHAHKARGYKVAAEVMAVYHFYCGETTAKAKEEPREAILRYLGAVVDSNREEAYSDQYTAYKGLKQGLGRMSYDYLLSAQGHLGGADQCVERIKEIQSTGVTNTSLLVNFGGLDHSKVMASFDRFAKYVMPNFR